MSSRIPPEHRARELLNLIRMSDRCSRLPGINEADRRYWEVESRRAWDSLQTLLPELAPSDGDADDVVALARRTAVELQLPVQARARAY